MKIKIFRPLAYVLILSMGFIFTFTSCGNDPDPMDLPPLESLVIDLGDFPTNNTGQKAAEAFIGNWLYSSITALAWNAVLAVNVAIPIAAYAEAFNHTPAYLGDNSWQWSYSVPVNQVIYTARLVGTRLNNEEFSMEMYLSADGDAGFTDFKWFEGVIRYDQTHATWTLSHSPDNPTEYLEVNYNKDFETGEASIRYTVTDPQNDLYNAYIEYGKVPSEPFDAYYTIMKSSGTTYIEWNTSTNEGRVMDVNHYGDDAWHCWDSQLADTDCTATK